MYGVDHLIDEYIAKKLSSLLEYGGNKYHLN